MYVRIT